MTGPNPLKATHPHWNGERLIRVGDEFLIDGGASVQFANDRAMLFRLHYVSPRDIGPHWLWLSGFVLEGHPADVGHAREILVNRGGLKLVRAHGDR